MIQRYEYYNANIEPRSDGRIVFYADAEKWVGEEVAKWAGDRKEWMDKAMALARKNCDLQKEIAKKNEMIAGMRENKLYLENDLALKMEQIAALNTELKSFAEAYNNTDWKKENDEQKAVINNLTVRWGQVLRRNEGLIAENKRQAGQIAVLTKFKKAVENDRCTECPFLEKETEREAEIAALKESFRKERAKRCQCEFDGGECFSPCKYHGKKDDQIAALKSLVDGASDIVEIWAAESPAQKEWKADWLAKAREALK